MKIMLGDYFIVGGFEQKSVFIKKDYSLPYYVSSKDIETKKGGFSISAGMTFVTTIMIRSIDAKNLQANPFLMVFGCLVAYFSIKWMFRGYNRTLHEVEEYQFPNEESLHLFIKEARRRNKVSLNFFIIFSLVTFISAFLYLKTNLFIFCFLTFGMFFCSALLAKYQSIKRIFVLRKIKKELIR